jgi:hypothetical protein
MLDETDFYDVLVDSLFADLEMRNLLHATTLRAYRKRKKQVRDYLKDLRTQKNGAQ